MSKPKTKTAYILLFRGVGGATQLPVTPLREALTEAGFENVATYINSGNAVLRSHLSREKVIAGVAKICADKFGFTKAIYAPTLEEWDVLISNNPFPDFQEGKHVHAVVLAGDPPAGAVESLRGHAVEGEAIAVVSGVAYLHTPFGLGTSKLGEKFDKGIGVGNTARNWNTVVKLRELAKKAAEA
jgi:uncharacterized protein (DUF1697 family)